MKIVIATDSFKGSLSATQVVDILGSYLSNRYMDATIVGLPLADGGEGLVECLSAALPSRILSCSVQGPLGQPVQTQLMLCGDMAVVEMAQAAGLPLLSKPDALNSTTYGVGEMIAFAEQQGAKRILLGLGGSATNDMGCGMAAALGCRFWDGNRYFVPTGGTLGDIKRIEPAAPHDIVALCDVKNPLYGPQGAAYVFGRQKGADDSQIEQLDSGLRHVANLLADMGIVGFDGEGTGAAGGLGAGVIAFLGGRLSRGIDMVLDTLHFAQTVQDADLVITGEGRLDSQSLQGKVIDGVIARCRCPVVAVVGQMQLPDYHRWGLEAVFDTARHQQSADYRAEARTTLLAAAEDLAHWIDANIKA